MSPDEPRIRKLYFTIAEVSAMTGLDAHVLRFWETEFDELRPRKNRSGHRTYTEEDVETVRRIQHLLKEEKYTIDGARQRLAARVPPPDDARERLAQLRAFLVDLRDTLPPGR